MPITVEVTVPPGALALGPVFDDHPEVEIELERVVPAGEDLMPYFWLSNATTGLEAVEETIRESTAATSLTRLTETDAAALYHAVWEPDGDQVTTALREEHCGCTEATGTSEGWELHLRFDDHENVVDFNRALTGAGVPVTLQRLGDFSPDPLPAAANPSPQQWEALQLADQHGYFEVPRECKISDLADEAGISNSAFSERLRRGVAALVDGAEVDHDASRP